MTPDLLELTGRTVDQFESCGIIRTYNPLTGRKTGPSKHLCKSSANETRKRRVNRLYSNANLKKLCRLYTTCATRKCVTRCLDGGCCSCRADVSHIRSRRTRRNAMERMSDSTMNWPCIQGQSIIIKVYLAAINIVCSTWSTNPRRRRKCRSQSVR